MIINYQLYTFYPLTIHFPSTSFSTDYMTHIHHIFIKSRIAALTDVRARQKALPLRWFPGNIMMVQSKKWMCSM